MRLAPAFEGRGPARLRSLLVDVAAGSRARGRAPGRRLVAEILPRLAAEEWATAASTWSLRGCVRTGSDVSVFSVGPSRRPPVAAVKLSRTDAGAHSLDRQSAALAALRRDLAGAPWARLLPEILAEGEAEGHPYVVERMLPGVEARRLVFSDRRRDELLRSAAETALELHRLTGREAVVGPDEIRLWIEEPIARVGLVTCTGTEGRGATLDRLGRELREALEGRRLAVAWVHGDYWSGNILVGKDGLRVCGVVDWEAARPCEPPLVDILHLVLSTRAVVYARSFGAVVRELLEGASWTAGECALLERAGADRPGDELPLPPMLLLTWLRHVAGNLTKSTRYAGHRAWVRRNVESVLAAL